MFSGAAYIGAGHGRALPAWALPVLTQLLALVPFIPILRDIPRWLPVDRLRWAGSPEP